MKILVILALTLAANVSFATETCENMRAEARYTYNLNMVQINNGIKSGRISKADANIYRQNAALILAQAESFCAITGE